MFVIALRILMLLIVSGLRSRLAVLDRSCYSAKYIGVKTKFKDSNSA